MFVFLSQNLKDEPRFGGIMFWDASFDQNNVINGKHYSEHIAAMFKNGPIPTGKPVTMPPYTGKTVQPPVTTAAPGISTAPTPAPTRPSTYL